MPLKDLLKMMFHAFFIITTGVVISMYVLCLLFNPNGAFSPVDIGGILLTACISDLSFLVFCSEKELSKKQLLLRFSIHILVLSAILLYLAYLFKWVNIKSPQQIAAFILLVLGVYAGTFVISFYQDKKTADKLNDSLKRRYHT